MNTEEQIQQVELSIEDAKETIRVMEMLAKMSATPEWKTIIGDGYFRDEASRLVLIRAEPSQQSPEAQKTINDQITAIGHLRMYLSSIMQTGIAMEASLESHEEALQELQHEDDGE